MPACLRKGAESSRIQELANNFDRKASKLTLNHRWPKTNTNTDGQNLQEKGEQMPQRSREVVVVVESVEKLRDDETPAMGWSCLGKPRNMLQIQLHMSLAYLIRETPSPARARDWILPRNLSSVRQQLSSPPQRQPCNSNVDDVYVDDDDVEMLMMMLTSQSPTNLFKESCKVFVWDQLVLAWELIGTVFLSRLVQIKVEIREGAVKSFTLSCLSSCLYQVPGKQSFKQRMAPNIIHLAIWSIRTVFSPS